MIRRLVDFYATQVRLIWKWRGGPVALAKRLAITVTVAAVSLWITAALSPGFAIASVAALVPAVVVIAAFNALIRPVLLAVVIPVSLLLTSIAVLALQVAAFLTAGQLVPGVRFADVGAAGLASFVYAIVNTTLTSVLGVDRGGSYFGSLVQAMRARNPTTSVTTPGLVVIQIDGLAHPVLVGRIRAGSVTTMASWIRSGSHRLARWEALLPSMTSASQLGILHGSNDGVPAFRWFDRTRQEVVVSSNPADAAMMVKGHSNGEGLLSNDGVSIANLVTGDATRAYVTTAALAGPSRGLGDSRAFGSFFLSPSGYLRSATLFLGEVIKEGIQNVRARRAGRQPRLERGLTYALLRAGSNVLLRDLNVSLIIEEMFRGANVIYADFTDYDEIAHHSGPERVEALDALDGIDTAIGTVVRASADVPRPYRFVVLSDHGQTLGATFKQRHGESLGGVVERLVGHGVDFRDPAETGTVLDTFLSDFVRGPGTPATIARRVLRARTAHGVVSLARPRERAAPGAKTVVLASGNLGLVYFVGRPERLTLDEIESEYPGLVRGLVAHPGVGFVLVHSASLGGIVLGRAGRLRLSDGTIEGEDPTRAYAAHVLAGLALEDAMADAPDILVISEYEADLGEVAAFEELIGSHGGVGGAQTEAFILHPSDWTLDEDVPIGAPAIYRNLRRWLEALGIRIGDGPTQPRDDV